MTADALRAPHPFHAIAALPQAQAVPLALIVERGGIYVRLTADNHDVLFKKRSDPIDGIDRIRFDRSKRIDLDEAVFDAGPVAALRILLDLLEAERSRRAGT